MTTSLRVSDVLTAKMVASPLTSLTFQLPQLESEQASLESVLDHLAPLFECVPAVAGERDGALLVVSDDAGSGTSVRFWREALAVGLDVASPGAFPWCLANAPCATIARRFGVVGPNLTWSVSFVDPAVAFEAPAAWLQDWLCSRTERAEPAEAWLVSVHFGGAGARVTGWHWSGIGSRGSRDSMFIATRLRDIMASDWSAD
jgi:hypothetical protein